MAVIGSLCLTSILAKGCLLNTTWLSRFGDRQRWPQNESQKSESQQATEDKLIQDFF